MTIDEIMTTVDLYRDARVAYAEKLRKRLEQMITEHIRQSVTQALQDVKDEEGGEL